MICLVIAAVERSWWGRSRPRFEASWWTAVRVRLAVSWIYALTGLECLYAGGLPIWLVLAGGEYDYTRFGIPTLHVVLLGAYVFLAIHWFALWLRTGSRTFLWSSILLLLINLLIVNRGAFFQVLLSMGTLYACHIGVRLRSALIAVGSLAFLTVVFGILGDARMVAGGINPESTILVLGQAAPSYPHELLGSGPFWLYLYAVSPIANWQLNISANTAVYVGPSMFAAIELLPDFLTKRLVGDFGASLQPALITDALSVLGAYGRAFFLSGWEGCIAVFVWFLMYYFAVRMVFKRTEYFESGLSTFAAGAALMTYFNMLTFSGLIAPLLVATIMRAFLRVRSRSTRASLRGIPIGSVGSGDLLH